MKFYTEITPGAGYPLHTYYLSDNRSKMVGYIRVGTTTLVKFSKPGHFDPRGRKFTASTRHGRYRAEADNVYLQSASEQPVQSVASVTVRGSTGSVYTLSKSGNRWMCSCPGYGYRGKCKHSEEVAARGN